MHNEISSLYFVENGTPTDTQNTNGWELEGDKTTFSFYTTAKSLYFPIPCLIRVTYKFVINDDEKGLLTREEKPAVNFSLEENMYLKSYVWSERLKDFSFQYSDGKIWSDSWNSSSKNQIPRAVRIILISPHEETFSTTIYIPTEI
jgi:hypothetical protein